MDENSTIPSKLMIIKTLSNTVRLEALFRLIIEQRLSLSQISSMVNKSKNTVIYHMKYLTTIGLVREYDEKVEGSIKPAKFYELNPFFWKTMSKNFEEIGNVKPEDILNASRNIFQWNILLFETIREFLRQLCTFYEMNGKKTDTASHVSEFFQQNRVPRDLVALSEQGYHEYMRIYDDFMQQVMHILETETQNSHDVLTTRPYMAINMVIPIQKLMNTDKTNIQRSNDD